MKKVFLLALCAAAAVATAFAQPSARMAGGLMSVSAEDCKKITAGDVTMTINPQGGGKILSLKYKDKEMISQMRFPESFGSTFWTSPQKEWNWPPVPEFDKHPYRVKDQRQDRLVLSSHVSERLGLSVGKVFQVEYPSMGGKGIDPNFTITYSIKNEGSEPRSVAPWEITRVPNGDGLIFFQAPVDSIWPAGLMTFESAHGAAWYKTDEAEQNRKVNADGMGWLAYCADGLLLVKDFDNLQAGQPAPGEAEVQVYVNRGKTYIELESQGAYKLLQPGEELRWRVRWYLVPVSDATQPSEELMEIVNSMIQ